MVDSLKAVRRYWSDVDTTVIRTPKGIEIRESGEVFSAGERVGNVWEMRAGQDLGDGLSVAPDSLPPTILAWDETTRAVFEEFQAHKDLFSYARTGYFSKQLSRAMEQPGINIKPEDAKAMVRLFDARAQTWSAVTGLPSELYYYKNFGRNPEEGVRVIDETRTVDQMKDPSTLNHTARLRKAIDNGEITFKEVVPALRKGKPRTVFDVAEALGRYERGFYSHLGLYENEKVRKPTAKQFAASPELRAKYGGVLAPDDHEAIRLRMFDAMLTEGKYQLAQARTGYEWYRNFMDLYHEQIRRVFPEMSDAEESIFDLMLAITSPSNKATSNVMSAANMWREFQAAQKEYIPTRRTKVTNPTGKKGQGGEKPVGYSPTGPDERTIRRISEARAKFESAEDFADWLERLHPVDEAAARRLIKEGKLPPDYDMSKTLKAVSGRAVEGHSILFPDGMARGAYSFGPKVGAFHTNVRGLTDLLTSDLWFNRMWNRIRGDTMKTAPKAHQLFSDYLNGVGKHDAGDIIQQEPRGAGERRLQTELVAKVADHLGVSVPDAQAILWYYEQQLWSSLGTKNLEGDFYRGALELVSDGKDPATWSLLPEHMKHPHQDELLAALREFPEMAELLDFSHPERPSFVGPEVRNMPELKEAGADFEAASGPVMNVKGERVGSRPLVADIIFSTNTGDAMEIAEAAIRRDDVTLGQAREFIERMAQGIADASGGRLEAIGRIDGIGIWRGLEAIGAHMLGEDASEILFALDNALAEADAFEVVQYLGARVGDMLARKGYAQKGIMPYVTLADPTDESDWLFTIKTGKTEAELAEELHAAGINNATIRRDGTVIIYDTLSYNPVRDRIAEWSNANGYEGEVQGVIGPKGGVLGDWTDLEIGQRNYQRVIRNFERKYGRVYREENADFGRDPRIRDAAEKRDAAVRGDAGGELPQREARGGQAAPEEVLTQARKNRRQGQPTLLGTYRRWANQFDGMGYDLRGWPERDAPNSRFMRLTPRLGGPTLAVELVFTPELSSPMATRVWEVPAKGDWKYLGGTLGGETPPGRMSQATQDAFPDGADIEKWLSANDALNDSRLEDQLRAGMFEALDHIRSSKGYRERLHQSLREGLEVDAELKRWASVAHAKLREPDGTLIIVYRGDADVRDVNEGLRLIEVSEGGSGAIYTTRDRTGAITGGYARWKRWLELPEDKKGTRSPGTTPLVLNIRNPLDLSEVRAGDLLQMWERVQDFVEKNHPTVYAQNMLRDIEDLLKPYAEEGSSVASRLSKSGQEEFAKHWETLQQSLRWTLAVPQFEFHNIEFAAATLDDAVDVVERMRQLLSEEMLAGRGNLQKLYDDLGQVWGKYLDEDGHSLLEVESTGRGTLFQFKDELQSVFDLEVHAEWLPLLEYPVSRMRNESARLDRIISEVEEFGVEFYDGYSEVIDKVKAALQAGVDRAARDGEQSATIGLDFRDGILQLRKAVDDFAQNAFEVKELEALEGAKLQLESMLEDWSVDGARSGSRFADNVYDYLRRLSPDERVNLYGLTGGVASDAHDVSKLAWFFDEQKRAMFSDMGYDGMIYLGGKEGTHECYVAFSPDQVRNAITRKQMQAGAEDIVLGSTTMMNDGRRMIELYKGHDFHTLLHEAAHVWQHDFLAEMDTTALNRAFGMPENLPVRGWTVDAKEQMAESMIDYFRTGKAPAGLGSTFEHIKKWMRAKYGNDLLGGVEVSPEIQKAFAQLFDGGASLGGIHRRVKWVGQDRETGEINVDAKLHPDLNMNDPKFWNNFDVPENIEATMRGMAAALESELGAARGAKISDGEVARLADEMGMKPEDLLRTTGPLTNVETVAARKLLVGSAERVRSLIGKSQAPGASSVDVYNAARAVALHSAIWKTVIKRRAEAGRGLRAWGIVVGTPDRATLARIDRAIDGAGGVEAMREALGQFDGIDTLGGLTRQAEQVAKKGRWGRLAASYYLSNLLWSPSTWVVNALGNTLALGQLVAERGLAGAFDADLRGEATAMAFGMQRGLRDAFSTFARTTRAGVDDPRFAGTVPKFGDSVKGSVAPGLGSGPLGELGFNGGGWLWESLNWLYGKQQFSTRLLNGMDQGFKALAWRAELWRLGWQDAKKQGYRTVQEAADHIDHFVRNATDEQMDEARELAEYATFTNDLGPKGQAIQGAVRAFTPASQLVIPFLRTPANLMKFAWERTPLAPMLPSGFGFNETGKRLRADIIAGGQRRSGALAKIALGTATSIVITSMVDEGRVTGSLPDDPAERRRWQRLGVQPYALNIGGKWYSYSRTDPVGLIVGISADLAQSIGHMQDDEADRAALLVAMGWVQALQERSYLQGAFQFADLVRDDTGFVLKKWVSRAAYGHIPFSALLRTLARTVDPNIRDTRAAGEDVLNERGIPSDINPAKALTDSMVNEIFAGLPWLSKTLPKRYDLWGREVKMPGSAPARALSPVRVTTPGDEQIDLIDQQLWENRVQIPEVDTFLPVRSYNYGAKRTVHVGSIPLNGEEYEWLSKKAGRALSKAVESDWDNVAPLPGPMQEAVLRGHRSRILSGVNGQPGLIDRARKKFPRLRVTERRMLREYEASLEE